MSSSPPFYLFTSSTDRVGVHTPPKYGIKPIQYVTLHFRDRRGAASLRHKNRAATTVLVGKQKPCPVWFSWRRNFIRYSVTTVVFLFVLCGNIFSPVPLLESRNVVPKSNFVFFIAIRSFFRTKRSNTFCYRLRLKEKFLLVTKVCTNPDCVICTCKVLKLSNRKRFPCFHSLT